MADLALDMKARLSAARLPSMPQILLKLLEICQSDEADMADIAKLIANDAALTARILTVANSAAYQRDGRRSGLVHSLNVLGSSMVKTLLISESVYQTFNSFSNTGNLDMGHFWRHSLSAAVIARDLSKLMAYAQVEEAYLAGLLHDAGRLALLAVAPTQYATLFLERDESQLCAAEARTFDMSHAEAGAWLVERWNLDSFMADSVRYHHEDAARLQSSPPLVRIVHLAHWLAAWPSKAPLPEGAGALCKVSDTDLDALRQRTAAQVEKAAALLGITLSSEEDLPAQMRAAAAMPAADPVRQRLTDEMRDMALTSEWVKSLTRVTGEAQRLTLIRQNAQVLFNLDDTLILLKSGNGQDLMCVSAGQQRQRLLDFAVSLDSGGGVAASALQCAVGFVERGTSACGMAEDQLLRAMGAEALVCVPLTVGTRALGVLVCAANARQLAEMRQRDRFLLSFGSHAATAMDAQAREAAEIDQHIARVRNEFKERSRSVAHEINNPLTIIKSYLGVLDDKLARDESVTNELSILNEELNRIGGIVGEFAGTAAPKPVATVDVSRLIEGVVTLFRESRFLPPTVQIASQVGPQRAEMEGSADTLKQILVNLIKNAVEALPQGGSITVINSGTVPLNGRPHHKVLVNDDGKGLPAHVLENLFKPVRSSKPGENRGIGLSIVHGLVQKLGGQIRCTSSASGTSFEILLPARMAAAQNAATKPASHAVGPL